MSSSTGSAQGVQGQAQVQSNNKNSQQPNLPNKLVAMLGQAITGFDPVKPGFDLTPITNAYQAANSAVAGTTNANAQELVAAINAAAKSMNGAIGAASNNQSQELSTEDFIVLLDDSTDLGTVFDSVEWQSSDDSAIEDNSEFHKLLQALQGDANLAQLGQKIDAERQNQVNSRSSQNSSSSSGSGIDWNPVFLAYTENLIKIRNVPMANIGVFNNAADQIKAEFEIANNALLQVANDNQTKKQSITDTLELVNVALSNLNEAEKDIVGSPNVPNVAIKLADIVPAALHKAIMSADFTELSDKTKRQEVNEKIAELYKDSDGKLIAGFDEVEEAIDAARVGLGKKAKQAWDNAGAYVANVHKAAMENDKAGYKQAVKYTGAGATGLAAGWLAFGGGGDPEALNALTKKYEDSQAQVKNLKLEASTANVHSASQHGKIQGLQARVDNQFNTIAGLTEAVQTHQGNTKKERQAHAKTKAGQARIKKALAEAKRRVHLKSMAYTVSNAKEIILGENPNETVDNAHIIVTKQGDIYLAPANNNDAINKWVIFLPKGKTVDVDPRDVEAAEKISSKDYRNARGKLSWTKAALRGTLLRAFNAVGQQ